MRGIRFIGWLQALLVGTAIACAGMMVTAGSTQASAAYVKQGARPIARSHSVVLKHHTAQKVRLAQ